MNLSLFHTKRRRTIKGLLVYLDAILSWTLNYNALIHGFATMLSVWLSSIYSSQMKWKTRAYLLFWPSILFIVITTERKFYHWQLKNLVNQMWTQGRKVQPSSYRVVTQVYSDYVFRSFSSNVCDRVKRLNITWDPMLWGDLWAPVHDCSDVTICRVHYQKRWSPSCNVLHPRDRLPLIKQLCYSIVIRKILSAIVTRYSHKILTVVSGLSACPSKPVRHSTRLKFNHRCSLWECYLICSCVCCKNILLFGYLMFLV